MSCSFAVMVRTCAVHIYFHSKTQSFQFAFAVTRDSWSLSVVTEEPLAEGASSSVVGQGAGPCAREGLNRLDLPDSVYLGLISQAALPVR